MATDQQTESMSGMLNPLPTGLPFLEEFRGDKSDSTSYTNVTFAKSSTMPEIIVSTVYVLGFAFIVQRLRVEFHRVRPQTQTPSLAEDRPKQAMAA